jgi:hypothetical protein
MPSRFLVPQSTSVKKWGISVRSLCNPGIKAVLSQLIETIDRDHPKSRDTYLFAIDYVLFNLSRIPFSESFGRSFADQVKLVLCTLSLLCSLYISHIRFYFARLPDVMLGKKRKKKCPISRTTDELEI